MTRSITQQQASIRLSGFPNVAWESLSDLEVTREVSTYYNGYRQPTRVVGTPTPSEVTLSKRWNPETDKDLYKAFRSWTGDNFTIWAIPVANDITDTPIGPAIICNDCVPGNFTFPEFDTNQPSELAMISMTFYPGEIITENV